MRRPVPAEDIQRVAASYNLVLQCKRLMLQSVLRRLAQRPSADLSDRAAQLEADIGRTVAARARLRVDHGDVEDPLFWVDAYGLLIQQGENLAGQIRRGRNDGAADLPLIDGHLELWRRRLRDWMVAASA